MLGRVCLAAATTTAAPGVANCSQQGRAVPAAPVVRSRLAAAGFERCRFRCLRAWEVLRSRGKEESHMEKGLCVITHVLLSGMPRRPSVLAVPILVISIRGVGRVLHAQQGTRSCTGGVVLPPWLWYRCLAISRIPTYLSRWRAVCISCGNAWEDAAGWPPALALQGGVFLTDDFMGRASAPASRPAQPCAGGGCEARRQLLGCCEGWSRCAHGLTSFPAVAHGSRRGLSRCSAAAGGAGPCIARKLGALTRRCCFVRLLAAPGVGVSREGQVKGSLCPLLWWPHNKQAACLATTTCTLPSSAPLQLARCCAALAGALLTTYSFLSNCLPSTRWLWAFVQRRAALWRRVDGC